MIIAFSGKRGVGKTVAAQYLSTNYGFKVVSFAGRLKELANLLFPFTPKDLYGANKEKPFEPYSWTPREFLINFGNFMRYYDPNYWIMIATKGISGNIAIDDLRYKNEARYLKDDGAKLIRISRFAKDNPYKGEINDPSETDLDDYKDFDYKINEVENISIYGLHTRLNHIMEELDVRRRN
jgi:hypothetical protein